jgi:hypothetical protein
MLCTGSSTVTAGSEALFVYGCTAARHLCSAPHLSSGRQLLRQRLCQPFKSHAVVCACCDAGVSLLMMACGGSCAWQSSTATLMCARGQPAGVSCTSAYKCTHCLASRGSSHSSSSSRSTSHSSMMRAMLRKCVCCASPKHLPVTGVQVQALCCVQLANVRHTWCIRSYCHTSCTQQQCGDTHICVNNNNQSL